jgi:hypothetical protein
MDVLTRHRSIPLLAMLALSLAIAAAAVASGIAEHRVKAAYLYKFIGYVEWPADAFASRDAPFVLGVIDAPELHEELARIVVDRRFGERRIVVRRVEPGDPLHDLHVLFVGGDEARGLGDALARLQQRPILVVTEAEPWPRGSMINFVVTDDRVRFDVAQRPAERQGLRISSLLLAVARRVSQDR